MIKKIKNKKHLSEAEYLKMTAEVELLMKKGEENLTKKEIAMLCEMAALIEAYEEEQKMNPVPRTKNLANEQDINKIEHILGYLPDLIEMVEFKLYQLKLNQNSLAGLLNMPASKISQILNRKREPDVAFLRGIHEQLGIDGNYILEYVKVA